MNAKAIDLLVPCLNEEESAPFLLRELTNTIQEIKNKMHDEFNFYLIIVDDGSTDFTVPTFDRLIRTSPDLAGGKIIELSRNFGKEAAILAGP